MAGRAKKAAAGASSTISRVHHSNAVRHLRHDAQVVRDHQNRHSRLALKNLQQLENLRLMVTSNAVVGSSAIRRAGRHASAIAIMARCFIPPDIKMGTVETSALSGIPTDSSSRARAPGASHAKVCRSSTSTIVRRSS
jgi:DNA-binding transcriptional LysR family regulator